MDIMLPLALLQNEDRLLFERLYKTHPVEAARALQVALDIVQVKRYSWVRLGWSSALQLPFLLAKASGNQDFPVVLIPLSGHGNVTPRLLDSFLTSSYCICKDNDSMCRCGMGCKERQERSEQDPVMLVTTLCEIAQPNLHVTLALVDGDATLTYYTLRGSFYLPATLQEEQNAEQ